jgi:hypothetical protein
MCGGNKEEHWIYLWHWVGNEVDMHHAHVRISSCIDQVCTCMLEKIDFMFQFL